MNANAAENDRFQRRQLNRLTTLVDVVYAVAIVLVFLFLPRPEDGNWASLADLLADEYLGFLFACVAIVILAVYWLQTNLLFGKLRKTDGRHSVIVLFQIFFTLVMVYSIRLGIEFEAGPVTRAFESVAVGMVGVMAFAGWQYAIGGRRLIDDRLGDGEALRLRIVILAEPLTAAVALACAFLDPIVWELSWFSYPLIALALRRSALLPKRHRKQ
jgi:uncharacterized membrane protein